MEDREWRMGNGGWGMEDRDREWGIGDGELVYGGGDGEGGYRMVKENKIKRPQTNLHEPKI